jgi:hypothetical protein
MYLSVVGTSGAGRGAAQGSTRGPGLSIYYLCLAMFKLTGSLQAELARADAELEAERQREVEESRMEGTLIRRRLSFFILSLKNARRRRGGG